MRYCGLNQALIVAALLSAIGTQHAEAALIVMTPSFAAAPGSSGTFDVVLQNTGPSGVSIGGFSFGISTTSAGITFTSATVSTGVPYIFDGDSLFGPDITISDGTSLIASDNPFSVAAYVVSSGATVGLGHVSYSIDSSAPGGPFAITLSSSATSLADGTGANIPIDTLASGTLTVTGVPEPTTVALVACGALLFVTVRRRRSS